MFWEVCRTDLAHVDAHPLAATLLQIPALLDLHAAPPHLLLALVLYLSLLHF